MKCCFNAENLEIAADLQRGSHQADGDFVRMITASNSRGRTDVHVFVKKTQATPRAAIETTQKRLKATK